MWPKIDTEKIKAAAMLSAGACAIMVAAVMISAPTPQGSSIVSLFPENLGDGLAAATWLGVQQGYPSYSGYPMPSVCGGDYGNIVSWYIYCDNTYYGSTTARIAVFSAHPPSSTAGQTKVLNGKQGVSGGGGLGTGGVGGGPPYSYLWTHSDTVPTGCDKYGCYSATYYYYWGECTTVNATTTISGNSVTCLQFGGSDAFSYSTPTAGTPVALATAGLPVVLEWSCQNAPQTYSWRYCPACFDSIGCCGPYNTYVYHNFASSAAGTNFTATGGALYGSVTVNPATTTTYTLSCKGYRHYYQMGDLASCNGGTASCAYPGNFQQGYATSSGSGHQVSITVTVAPTKPTVTTNAASSITLSSATLNGTANPNSIAATGWFRYSTTNPSTCDDTFGTKTPSSGTSLGSGGSSVAYSQGISGLPEETVYYYCALASNAAGTATGTIVSFTTGSSDVCSDIPGTQLTAPSAPCVTPPSTPGQCVPSGYTWDGAQCLVTPTVSDFHATPSRVRKGDSSVIAWTVSNPPVSCTIASTPSLSGFPATISTFPTGSLSTGAINQRTIFALTCGAAAASQATITIVPTVIEI